MFQVKPFLQNEFDEPTGGGHNSGNANDDVFDFLQSEDDDLGINFFQDEEIIQAPKTEEIKEELVSKTNEELTASNEEPEELTFDDEIKLKADKDQELSEEEIIKKLQEKGFKVEKPEEVPLDLQQEKELERINNFLEHAENFLSQPDEIIIKEKLRSELANEYSRKNKGHLIGTEEFEIDLEAEMSEYDSNVSKKLMADSIRRDINDLVKENQGKKEGILNEQTKKVQEKVDENKFKLQETLRSINKQGIFRLQVSQEDAKEIYNSITSGEFSKTVNNDPQLVAEFATYLKYREKIKNEFGGPTYGEGVKAAIDSLENKDKSSRSPLIDVVKQSNSTSGLNNRKSWAMPVIDENEEIKVAGKGY